MQLIIKQDIQKMVIFIKKLENNIQLIIIHIVNIV